MKNKNAFLLFLFALLLYGLFSDIIPLLDPDEPVYGETAKEMLLTGDWLSPRIYGEYWYDKPPLFYWLDAFSFSIFGISTFAARFPSAVFGACTAAYLYLSTRKLIGEKTALTGAFICATSLEIIVLARSAVTDTTLVFALTVALISFLRKEYVTAYIACGFALLAKGPIGFGFPAIIVTLWMIVSKQFTLKNIMALKWYWGIPLACLVGLPWFIYMAINHGSVFVDTFFGYHNLARFSSPEHMGKNHLWLFFIVLAAGFYPWTGAIPGIFRHFPEWRKDRVLLFFYVWAIFIFTFFSFSSTQLFSYILPMFPPLSLLAGKYMVNLEETGHISKLFLVTHLLFTLVTAGAMAWAPIVPPDGKWVQWCVFAVMTAAGLIAAYFFKKGRFKDFLISQGLIVSVFVLSVWFIFDGPVTQLFTSENIAKELKITERENKTVYIDTFYRPSIAFYENIYGKALPKFDKETLAEAKKNKEKGILLPTDSTDTDIEKDSYLLVQEKVYNRWPEEKKQGLHLIWKKDTALFFYKEF